MNRFASVIISAVVCVMSIQTVSAQKFPEEEDILSKILPDDSPYYYPAMMLRYAAGDETLTDDHYYYLYYGYAYNDAYDAHKPLPGEAVMYEVFQRTERPSREDALALIEAGRQNMLADPFSPGNLNMMTWAYQIAGDTLNADASARRFRGVVGAITSSGTGIREKSPWHILRFSHANDIVAGQGKTIVNRQVRSRDVEYVQVDKNDEGVKGYFFNFGRVYWNPYEGGRVKKGSGWLFNGVPI